MSAPMAMPVSSSSVGVDDVVAEVLWLAQHRHVPLHDVRATLEQVRPWLSSYAEWVLTEDGFEIITGGVGPRARQAVCDIAASAGLSSSSVRFFRAVAEACPDVMVGVKVPFTSSHSAPTSPTAYVRTALAKDDARQVLKRAAARAGWSFQPGDVVDEHPSCDTLYGIGVVDDDGAPMLKTYVLQEVGDDVAFVSLRLNAAGLHHAHKEYAADVEVKTLQASPLWGAALTWMQGALGIDTVGHVGREVCAHRADRWKIYVERIGRIATDRSLR